MLNCLEPDTTQVIEYCWCEHTILTRNINVPLLSSKCYSITRLSINIFLFCPNITKAEYSHTVLIDAITKFATLNQNIVYYNVYCIIGIFRNLAGNFQHISKTHSITESIKICRFKTFWVKYFA